MTRKRQTKAYSRPHFKFSPDEDSQLRLLVQELGCDNWAAIASKMPGRNSRQCRERWNNYLSPKINNNEWTAEEDEILLEKYEEYGPRWVIIAKYLNRRTDQMVKNRYCILIRRKSKEKLVQKAQKKKQRINSQNNYRVQPFPRNDQTFQIESLESHMPENSKKITFENNRKQNQNYNEVNQEENKNEVQKEENQDIFDDVMKYLQMITEEEWESFNDHLTCNIFSNF